MDQVEAIIKAEESTRKLLEEAGWEVQEVVILAIVTAPEDEHFNYQISRKTLPAKMSEENRSRLIGLLRQNLDELERPDPVEEIGE